MLISGGLFVFVVLHTSLSLSLSGAALEHPETTSSGERLSALMSSSSQRVKVRVIELES
jgi:hypothetical protein